MCWLHSAALPLFFSLFWLGSSTVSFVASSSSSSSFLLGLVWFCFVFFSPTSSYHHYRLSLPLPLLILLLLLSLLLISIPSPPTVSSSYSKLSNELKEPPLWMLTEFMFFLCVCLCDKSMQYLFIKGNHGVHFINKSPKTISTRPDEGII